MLCSSSGSSWERAVAAPVPGSRYPFRFLANLDPNSFRICSCKKPPDAAWPRIIEDTDVSMNQPINEIVGSYDPNEKEVSPAGNITESDSVLTYTIHFQNTGTDTTSFIVVRDTLSQYLDPLSVINIASSHEFNEFEIAGDGILKWVFNPIFLVDSGTNEPESKGFIMFSIHKRSNLPFGTLISNNAAISNSLNS